MFWKKCKEIKGSHSAHETDVLKRFNELTIEDVENISEVEVKYSDFMSGKWWGIYYVSFRFKKICWKSWEFVVIKETGEVLTENEYKERCGSMVSKR
jgi:hypothetical protein